MTGSTDPQPDLDVLKRLNADYLASDQNGDVQRYSEMLAEDFTATLPDLMLRDKTQFLEMMREPRPFTELRAHDVVIRLLGEFAIIHARIIYRTLDGVERHGRYTDDYQRRDGEWLCVAANVIVAGV